MMTRKEYQAAIREMREDMLLCIGCDEAPKWEDTNLCEDCLAEVQCQTPMVDFDPIERKEVATMTTVNILYKTCEGCERCKVDAYVPHYNCLYQGRAIGHSMAHCTASGCY